jgi:hypothetical protein
MLELRSATVAPTGSKVRTEGTLDLDQKSGVIA